MSYQENEINVKVEKRSGHLLYASIALAVFCALLPFLNWLKVPVAEGLYSFFGMSDAPTKFSLFGYIFSGSTYQEGAVFLITMIIALIAFAGVIFNVVYVVKAIRHKEKCYKYGTLGSVIMLIVSVLFIVLIGLMCLILRVFELTYMPYLAFIASIANIVIIKKLKAE